MVNKVTPVSLGYPLSVFNKNSTLKERTRERKSAKAREREREKESESEKEKEQERKRERERLYTCKSFFLGFRREKRKILSFFRSF